jgi:hypothetical protein
LTQSISQHSLADAWSKGLRWLQLKFNFHLGLSLARHHLLAWCWLLAAVVLAVRCGWDVYDGGAVLGLFSLPWAAWLMRRFWVARYHREDLLRELDGRLKLHHALHCAARELGPWPELQHLRQAQQLYGIRYSKALGAPSLGVAILLVALWIPLDESPALASTVLNPWALQDMEQWLEKLQEDPQFKSETLQNWAKSLEELKQKESTATPQQAAALREATDRLHDEMQSSLGEAQSTLSQLEAQNQALQREFQRNLSLNASGEAQPSSSSDPKHFMPQGAAENLQKLLAQARQLQLAWTPPSNSALGQALQSKSLQGLEYLPELQATLRESLARCESCLGIKPSKGSCSGTETCSGNSCTNPGYCSGSQLGMVGVSHGRGDADLTFGPPSEILPLSNLETLPANQVPQLGDRLESQLRAPEATGTPWSPTEASPKAQKPAESTGVIWKSRLRPEEQQVLRRIQPSP